MSKLFSFRGIHYRNIYFYNLITILKLGKDRYLRYKIAAKHLEGAGSVLDICAGEGKLKDFLPAGVHYTAVEAGENFIRILSRKKIPFIQKDIHQEEIKSIVKADAIVMLISLYQFRKTSLDSILEEFKHVACQVVIVEEVLKNSQTEDSVFFRLINFLCATDYYVPVGLFSLFEFEEVMKKHGYRYYSQGRYCIGLYDGTKG